MIAIKEFFSKTIYTQVKDLEYGSGKSLWEVSDAGALRVLNTGGSSAGDGGMGSGSTEDTEKGDLVKPGEKSGSKGKDDDAFDPIKKSVKEAEKKRDDEQ